MSRIKGKGDKDRYRGEERVVLKINPIKTYRHHYLLKRKIYYEGTVGAVSFPRSVIKRLNPNIK